MKSFSPFSVDGYSVEEALWEEGDRVFCRGWRDRVGGHRDAVLAVLPTAEPPTPGSITRITHEYELKDDLDRAWALRPLELVRESGRTALILEYPRGEPLDRLIGPPMEVGRFLRLAIAISAALGRLHERGLVHKDIKPTNILVNSARAEAWLTGFGIASRVSRERQSLEPPEAIAGTLAYMAPEQTGRMNRSIDSRSDLYSLGITLYEMLTGVLPFSAADPMAWVHCHIARQPMPPSETVPEVPAQISSIVMKLLAKHPEDRYQTAAGVVADLQRCLMEWDKHRRIDLFPLGTQDASDRLMIPERLYGREAEIAALLASFDRVVDHGATEFVLVSGYSGIGKSSLVNELHKELIPPRGLFAAGKFDQYKQNIPYSTVAQAFQSLVRQILGKSDAEMSQWRAALVDALGPNGQLMVNLVPELAHIIGDQPPPPELLPPDQQARFQLVFQRFLGVFARSEHPLALFLDDLQWLDSATLDLIEHLILHSDVRHLLLVGAYRDNEINPLHPLARMLATIREAGGSVQEIRLAPLRPVDLERLLADALHTGAENAPLANLVFQKTAGNPFFTIQFLTTLAEESLLAFDRGKGGWIWDLPGIDAKGFTDNVARLMAAKLSHLPPATQNALGQLASLGNVAETATIALVRGEAEESIHAALWGAVRAGFLTRSDSTYTFLHDRIREAAYALIAEGERAVVHLRIGRLLAERTAPEALEENIFDIVNQFDRGVALITTKAERIQVAELNLKAGKRAQAATAYAEALRYFATAGALLPESRWEQHPQLAFELELHWAECEYLSGAMTAAEERLSLLSTRAKTTGDLAAVTCLRVNLYTNLDQLESAVGVGLEYLRRFDGAWSRQATAEDVRHAYDRLWERLGSQAIQALLDLPWMSDSDQRSTMGVLTEMAPPTSFIDENLFRLVVCRMTTLSLDHGNSNGSCLAYVRLGAILSTYFGNYQAGFRFGKLGLDLVEKRGLDGFRSRVYLVFANHVASWTQGLSTCQAFLRRAFETAREAGDQTYAAYSGGTLITNLLATGESLSEVERDAKKSFEFVRKVRFGLIGDCITAQVRFTRTLRGLTSDLTSFGDAEFDELQFVQHVESSPQLAIAACWYWIRKLQASVYANDSISAIAATLKVAPLLWVVPSQFELAEYHFYGALARAAHCDVALVEERAQHFEALTTHHRQLEVWAENCPENFENRAALVGAEIARIEGRELDAEHLYEQAIRSAHTNGFVHNEALANERAAYFYAARSFARIAQTYLRDARYCYLRWGADGKVRQLDDLYPHLKEEKPGAGPTSTILAPVEHLDVATVIKVSQAVSGEIVLEKLIDTLMRIAIEHAGAERGLLILVRGDGYRIVAEATTSGDAVAVNLRQATVTPEDLPESILHYVVRTKESVLLHDALRESPFSADEYIHRHHARSILCLPLIKQAKLIAVLYLENNLASQVFTSARMTILKLLVSEAAVSLENTRLYGELQEREAKVRRLIDSNIIGICTWGLNRRITGANEAFLRIVGYAREDLLSGRLGWRDLTPAEWHDADARCRAELKATGVGQPYEKEYFHRSGSRVPVLVGAANFEGSQHEGVAFVVDLTDLKRVERAARESERRYREIEIGLAHANRVATMGQLSASIAHEVNQPIGAAVTNAHVALRWLDAEPQNLEKVRQALRRVVKNGDRAGDVINRIRGFIKKAPPQKSSLDINQAILEVIALTSNEAAKHNISVQTQFVENLPLVEGDRVQLQQVVLNLIMNAVEAMSGLSEGPRELLISTAKNEPDGVLVAVRDAGQGLMPTDLDRVFEPFYTTKSEGLGIGLSICRSIIEAHEGRMWATANEPRGAIFKFTLPSRAPLDQTLPRAR